MANMKRTTPSGRQRLSAEGVPPLLLTAPGVDGRSLAEKKANSAIVSQPPAKEFGPAPSEMKKENAKRCDTPSKKANPAPKKQPDTPRGKPKKNPTGVDGRSLAEKKANSAIVSQPPAKEFGPAPSEMKKENAKRCDTPSKKANPAP